MFGDQKNIINKNKNQSNYFFLLFIQKRNKSRNEYWTQLKFEVDQVSDIHFKNSHKHLL